MQPVLNSSFSELDYFLNFGSLTDVQAKVEELKRSQIYFKVVRIRSPINPKEIMKRNSPF